jgi:hypothetical protein
MGIGGVLSQVGASIDFFIEKLNDSRKKYSTMTKNSMLLFMPWSI